MKHSKLRANKKLHQIKEKYLVSLPGKEWTI
jgi:hypothetical protein